VSSILLLLKFIKLFSKKLLFFSKPLDKRKEKWYYTLGILRQQVPVKALSFPAEV